MRVLWPPDFPPVFVHSAWGSEDSDVSLLADDRDYWPAKKRRDAAAALRLCGRVHREAVLEKIYDAAFGPGESPIVIAPALTLHESQNALASGYAQWLAATMGWELGTSVYQEKTMSRDFSSDGWFRLANEPSFYGTVLSGRRYVIADDVCTMGGTLASLRGFIESKGGQVICMTTLASGDGRHVEISLAEQTLSELIDVRPGVPPDVFCTEMGYEIGCLTGPEGRFLLRCPSVDLFREGVNGARNG